ncbi:MAG: EVE domain-containing protein [Bacteroidia bacterium]
MNAFAWILKTEPSTYGWDDLVKEGDAIWDGVRNYRARNFLKEMRLSQKVLIYHSGKKREIVGIAEVIEEAFKDQTDETGKFVAVKVKALKRLKNPVSLEKIKGIDPMQESLLLKQSRLSVIPVSLEQFNSLIQV